MLSYGGVLLSEPDGFEPGAWTAENIEPEKLFPLARLNWPGTIVGGPILEQTAPPWRPVRIGSLFWPWSASRFAHGYFVVSESQLAAIRATANGASGYRSQPFVMDDGTRNVTTNLWMLPAWPLSTATAGIGLYLLPLVDDRYWWMEKSLALSVTAGVTLWTDLYASIGTALGVTIKVDPIPSAYLTPTTDYAATYRPVPLVLDAIAFSVGQRLIRRLDGTVYAQNYATAAANTVAQAALYGKLKYAGGTLAVSAYG